MSKIAIFRVFGGFGDPPGDPLRGCLGWYIPWDTMYPGVPLYAPLGVYMCIPGYVYGLRMVHILVQNGYGNDAISETQA